MINVCQNWNYMCVPKTSLLLFSELGLIILPNLRIIGKNKLYLNGVPLGIAIQDKQYFTNFS